jgi:hypothetical protein
VSSQSRNRSATAICAACGNRFLRARYRNQFRTADVVVASSRYCSAKCRQLAYRLRRAINLASGSVTRASQGAAERASAGQKEVAVGTLGGSVTRDKFGTVIPDERYPGMYRIRLPDGRLTDMVNLTRARDGLAAVRNEAST